MSFSLDEYATSVDFLLSYNAGPTSSDPCFVDFYADYIATTRNVSLNLPKCTAVLVSGWWETRGWLLAMEFEQA